MAKPRQNRRGQKDKTPKEYEEVMVDISRVTKVTRGGRQLKFRATMVIGNRKGKVGVGTGKSGEVTGAIQKAVNKAKKNLIEIPIQKDSIPHNVKVKYKSAKVLIMPAAAGTGLIAGSSIRQVLELAGIKNVLAKRFGSTSKLNNAKATIKALAELRHNPLIKEDKKKELEKTEIDGKNTEAKAVVKDPKKVEAKDKIVKKASTKEEGEKKVEKAQKESK